MNASHHFRAVAAVLLLGGSLPLPGAPADDFTFVRRNGPAEWAAGGDFNGDGRMDAVIVDRVTGTYRIGYQAPDGALAWTAPRASGVADVSGVTVGHLFNGASHGLAFTAEAVNRINLAAADNPAVEAVPLSVFISAVGPNQVVALDIGGPGNTPLDDLVVPSVWNGLSPYRLTTVRNSDGSSFSPIGDVAATQRLERGNRVVYRTGQSPALAVLARGATDTLRLIGFGGGLQATLLQFPNLAGGSEYAAGRFGGSALMRFLAFRPGRSNCLVLPVLEPVPGTFQAGASFELTLPGQIESLVFLPEAPGVNAKLLAVFDGGTRAAALAFDGTNAPVVLQEFLAPEGETLLGATPMEAGGARLHSGVNGRTTQSLHYAFNPGTGAFSLQHQEVLPAVSDLSGRANVFQFQLEPFVASAPRLLNTGRAGDWSSLFTLLGGPPQVGVTTETYVDATHGLDNPVSVSLGAGHPLAQFGLGNQYNAAVSIYSLKSGAGPEVVEVKAQPPGGLQAQSVGVNFTVSAAGYQVLYRFNPSEAWKTYVAPKPVHVFTNTTLQFRARDPISGSQSAVHQEIYVFKGSPSTLDSDSDGVPDFAEIANDLDPVGSGSDADKDGYSDLEELLKGTDPANFASRPAVSGYEQHAAVDWVVTPRPLNGNTGGETTARGGTQVRVFDLSGSILASAAVTNPPAIAWAASAVASNVFLDPRRPLLLVATDPHYDINGLLLDRRLGREMVAILPSPEVPPIQVSYAFGGAGGVLAAEALNWVAAAKAAYGAATNELRFRSMTYADTTVALLLEEKLRSVLAAGLDPVTNLTLFSFRTADAGRRAFDEVAQEQLQRGDAKQPAYDLKQLYHSLDTLVMAAPSPQVMALQAVAREIYRVSSASNNAAPGQFPLPLDVLREFIRLGVLHSNYVAAGSFPPTVLADAGAGVQSVLSSLGPRPVTNLTLRVRPDTLAGPCTTLETADLAAVPVHLFATGGGAFDFPDTFELIPGSVVQVVGYSDATSTTCAGLKVEVLSIALAAVPSRSDGDADGNLLIDAWENQLLGGLGADPFGDDDGDGYTNLQEMLDGTDPRDRLGRPTVPAAAMKIPSLAIGSGAGAGDGVTLEWIWPEAYAGKVEFQILSTPDLNLAPTVQTVTPVHQGGGVWRVQVPNTGGTRFFKVGLMLKL